MQLLAGMLTVLLLTTSMAVMSQNQAFSQHILVHRKALKQFIALEMLLAVWSNPKPPGSGNGLVGAAHIV